jgi:hypothetical protein
MTSPCLTRETMLASAGAAAAVSPAQAEASAIGAQGISQGGSSPTGRPPCTRSSGSHFAPDGDGTKLTVDQEGYRTRRTSTSM